jgi:GNAT superfamily N-acetyltransferase
MIRLATVSDMPELLRMGRSFFDASGYSEIAKFNSDDTKATLISLIEQGSLLTDGSGGMIGYLVFPLYMDNSSIVAQELFWWVDESERKSSLGVNLLKEAEKNAKHQGANTMMMLSLNKLNGSKVNSLYESLGYTKREQTYMRAI